MGNIKEVSCSKRTPHLNDGYKFLHNRHRAITKPIAMVVPLTMDGIAEMESIANPAIPVAIATSAETFSLSILPPSVRGMVDADCSLYSKEREITRWCHCEESSTKQSCIG